MSESTNHAIKLLKTVNLFQHLQEDDLSTLAQTAEERTIYEAEYLFREAAPRKEMLFIVNGEVEILKSIGKKKEVLGIIRKGNFIGEGAILDDSPHSSSCRARTDTKVISLKREALEAFFESHPQAANSILSELARVIASRLEYANYGYKGRRGEGFFSDGSTRTEHDLLGERRVPLNAYFGIQTLRAMENFHITGIPLSHFPSLIRALAMVKKACAKANVKLKMLSREVGEAICAASDDIIAGSLHNQFTVDMIQGGAGTSTNMNANEVIANRALEILGHQKGDYEKVHPNNHVNLSQSTNDAYPTAIRLAILLSYDELTQALEELNYELKQKAVEFAGVIKMGRTQLQDAVPMTLGQEFEAYYVTLKEDIQQIHFVANLFKEINLGATAIGTGINTHPEYASLAAEELSHITEIEFKLASNLIEATSDMGAFIMFSGVLRRVAVKISKICNDLRLLSSGPRAGFNEINLEPMQPGSSIMPGKVNPVIPEVVNQVAYQVIGNDLTITMAAEAGQLELNVMEPVIAFNIFQSIEMLANAILTLAHRGIRGITANVERCRELVENSIGLVTALNPYIGYENSSAVAKEALKTGKKVVDIVLERKLLSENKLKEIMRPENMTKPHTKY
jgi:aspartate ammonia-lyase